MRMPPPATSMHAARVTVTIELVDGETWTAEFKPDPDDERDQRVGLEANLSIAQPEPDVEELLRDLTLRTPRMRPTMPRPYKVTLMMPRVWRWTVTRTAERSPEAVPV